MNLSNQKFYSIHDMVAYIYNILTWTLSNYVRRMYMNEAIVRNPFYIIDF